MQHQNVIIIGGGPAGRVVARMTRNAGKSVTVIKAEEINASRCVIPYGIIPKKPPEQYFIPNSFILDTGATLLIDRVTGIDSANAQLFTSKGEQFSYDHLVLATGAHPVIPPMPGVDARNVTPLRVREDMVMIRELGQQSRKAVILGGGYIGIEVATVLHAMGLEVTIVEKLPGLLSMRFEAALLPDIEEGLRSEGVEVRTGTAATEICTSNGTATGVQLESGEVLDADFVVLAVGATPNIELASESGIAATPYGFVTDEFLRTNVPNIYAAGDCAEKKSFITGKPVRGDFGTNAVMMAKVVGANILGQNRRFPGVINTNAVAAFGFSFGSAGLSTPLAQEAGLAVVSGFSDVLNKYPMMDGVDHIKTVLLFEKATRKLVGGSVVRKDHCTVHNVDFLSMAIQMGATMEQVMNYQYAAHPDMAARPSDNMFVFAAQDARKQC